MKRFFLIGTMLCMCSLVTFSQLKVTNDGKVGIGISATPVSKLAVGTVGEPTFSNMFHSDNNTMNISSDGTYSNMGNAVATLLVGMEATSSRIYYALMIGASKSTPSSSGRSIGIHAASGNATNGYNWSVIGNLKGSNYGAGIFGGVGTDGGVPITDGQYAGYFAGNVKVTGYINGTVVGSSDIRYKQNITDLGSTGKAGESVLRQITGLNPISYNYKQVYDELRSDTLNSKVGHFDEKSQAFQKKHYGLIAQDLQKIYPDLVYESDNGYLAVNYTEIIPLLIQSIKELKEEVDLLSASLVNTRSTTSNDILDGTPGAALYQNAPNPFSDRTEIKFTLPQNIKSAFIYVFNMQGALVKQIPVHDRQQSVIINGSELTAGMYIYSLIIDGKEIDTKRMILTK